MTLHPLAGKPAPAETLVDVDRLIAAYFERQLDPENPEQRVAFGTSGHRGTPHQGSFNEPHILAITQAICDYRRAQGINGPLYLGKDTHALSLPAEETALEVLVANDVEIWLAPRDCYTPTPVVSFEILRHNRGRTARHADGIVITPSHNPPEDGGFKYSPPNGGPADTEVTDWIQNRANQLLKVNGVGIRRVTKQAALGSSGLRFHDFTAAYLAELPQVVDIESIARARLKIGVDPLGGASLEYWRRIAERFHLDLTIVNPTVDPRFAFMSVDHDGKIRMDCSSAFAMQKLLALKADYTVAFGNDPDADRHGIVTPSLGLLNPNHYLAVAIDYLFTFRTGWSAAAEVGKTLVSSMLIDRVARRLGRGLAELPVGFKWFVDGLLHGHLGFAGEESAGASFLRRDGTVWTTDKDGILLCLLAAEITAQTGKDPGEHYLRLARELGTPYYARRDIAATPAEKAALKKLSPEQVRTDSLAGEPILAKLTTAPANGASIGGLKVMAETGWFAARPSGTENVYKVYAESFRSSVHLAAILEQAEGMVRDALAASVPTP